MPSLTESYSRLHRALADVAAQNGLVPADVRVLLALAEQGGTSTTDVLERDLQANGTHVRRSLLALRPEWCTGGDKRGMRLPVTLTDRGWRTVDLVLDRVRFPEAA